MSGFFRSITGIPTPFNMIVLIVLICTVAGVITSIVKEVRKFLCHREESKLKREMLESGMSAQEIVQVIQAKDLSDPHNGK